MALVPELEKLKQELEAVNADVQKLVSGLSEDQLAWRAQPGRWSIAENLVHLNLGNQTYIPSLDRAIESARQRRLTGGGPFRLDFAGRLFVSYLEPPYRMKSKAPGMIKPLLQGPATDAVQQFFLSQQLIFSRLEAAKGLDLNRAKFVSPLSNLLRMNLLAAFSVLTSHQRRHLWQCWQIRRAMEQSAMKAAG